MEENDSFLSTNSKEKIKWLCTAWDRWIWSEKEGDPEFLGMTLDTIFKNFPGIAPQYLKAFITKIKKQTGEEYPPNTLFQMAQTIQILIKDQGLQINIFEDDEFKPFRLGLDSKMKELTRQGYRREKRQAEIIIAEMEIELWEKGILGINNALQLVQTVYFLVGKHFCLRGRSEHHNLLWGANSQIQLLGMGAQKRIKYVENISKTNGGGLKHAKKETKTGYIFPTGGDNCPVQIIEFYMSKIPPEATKFYNRVANKDQEGKWYWNQPMGVHKLNTFMPVIAKKAGWDMTKLWSGHSLRASTVNTLLESGFSESDVRLVSGHATEQGLIQG